MATPIDRRVIFSSYVIPKEEFTTDDLEETTEEGFSVGRADYLKDKIDSNVNKRLGGKGIATITPLQWNDGWSSMYHPARGKVTWDSLGDTTDVAGNDWQDEYTTWSGVYVAIAPKQLTAAMDATPLTFLYIRNLDDTNNVLVKVQIGQETFSGDDTNWDAQTNAFTEEMKIKISPGASICLRGDGDLQCDEVFVASDSGVGTKIEYLIAK